VFRSKAAVAHKKPAFPEYPMTAAMFRETIKIKVLHNKLSSHKPVQVFFSSDYAVANCYGFLVSVTKLYT
jgi:hypothetical protein